MKFSTMVVFMILWGTLVYCPICHWVWGGGILAYKSPNADQFAHGGALDFAGGTVVHISSGVSALVCALLIGKRLGYGREPMPPHNLTYTAFGAAMLWVGWFGFNAGSALAADGVAASAFAATHFSAAAGALAWAAMEWITSRQAHAAGRLLGRRGRIGLHHAGLGLRAADAGLDDGRWRPAWSAIWLAPCSSRTFGYDDSLDAFGVHGVGGTLGAILTGVFATRAIKDLNGGQPLGLFEGGNLLVGQLIATAVTWVFAAVVTFVLLKLLDATMGLRVATEEEVQGLDLNEHGEEGYIFL